MMHFAALAASVEGYVLRRYQAVESTDGVLSLIVLASLALHQSGFDYACKALELDYLGFYKLHIGWESKKNVETNRREMGLVKRFIEDKIPHSQCTDPYMYVPSSHL